MITVGRLISSRETDYPTDHDSDPNYVLLYMARAFDVDLFLFEPEDVDYESKTVRGLFAEGGAPVRKTVPIPPLVDNHYTGVDEELSKYTTLARIYPGDTKLTTYTDLKASGKYDHILIPTHPVDRYEDLTAYLHEYGEVVVKPVLGAQGVGVVKIEKTGDRYRLNTRGVIADLSGEELALYYKENLSEDYILQQYIDCRTAGGNPFDIRIRVVDRGGNDWAVALYARIGLSDGILSNNCAGGHTLPTDYFLKSEFGEQWESIQSDLLKLGRELPAHYAKLIHREIFELGLSVFPDFLCQENLT